MVMGGEAAAGDHDEAVISVADLGVVWGLLVLTSATLADLGVTGWLPVDWWMVAAPAVVPLLVLVAVLLVALSSDVVDALRGRGR